MRGDFGSVVLLTDAVVGFVLYHFAKALGSGERLAATALQRGPVAIVQASLTSSALRPMSSTPTRSNVPM
jgi:hypothetical protein